VRLRHFSDFTNFTASFVGGGEGRAQTTPLARYTPCPTVCSKHVATAVGPAQPAGAPRYVSRVEGFGGVLLSLSLDHHWLFVMTR